jgi:hypothetical protein
MRRMLSSISRKECLVFVEDQYAGAFRFRDAPPAGHKTVFGVKIPPGYRDWRI